MTRARLMSKIQWDNAIIQVSSVQFASWCVGTSEGRTWTKSLPPLTDEMCGHTATTVTKRSNISHVPACRRRSGHQGLCTWERALVSGAAPAQEIRGFSK